VEEHLQELKATYPLKRIQHDRLFALGQLYIPFLSMFPEAVQEAIETLYKQELATKTDDGNGSTGDDSSNISDESDLSASSELDNETLKGFYSHHFSIGRRKTYTYYTPILAEPFGTPDGAITPASVYHQNCFAHMSAKDIPDPEE
jgi:hypothetical protein